MPELNLQNEANLQKTDGRGRNARPVRRLTFPRSLFAAGGV